MLSLAIMHSIPVCKLDNPHVSVSFSLSLSHLPALHLTPSLATQPTHLFAFDPALGEFVSVPMPILDGLLEKVYRLEPSFFGVSLSSLLIKGVVCHRMIAPFTVAADDIDGEDEERNQMITGGNLHIVCFWSSLEISHIHCFF